MSLNIRKSNDPIIIEQLVLLFYGDPGVGKTTLGFSAESPLLLDFDRGAHRSAFRGDTVQISDWNDIRSMSADDLKSYKTLVIDTVGKCLDALARDIMSKNAKMRGIGGALSLQGYGALASGFSGWLSEVKAMGKDVVMIAHSKEESSGEETVMRPALLGKKSLDTIFQDSDVIGFIHVSNGRPTIEMGYGDGWFSKAPPAIGARQISDRAQDPDGTFLADLIEEVKGILNEQSAESKALADLVSDFSKQIAKVNTPEAMTKMLAKVNAIEDKRAITQLKPVMAKHVKKAGYTFVPEKEAFTIELDEAE